jgi:hypothetical protein
MPTLSVKERVAALFRVWHAVSELIEQAEQLGDGELVHHLAVVQLVAEEGVVALGGSTAVLDGADTSLPN